MNSNEETKPALSIVADANQSDARKDDDNSACTLAKKLVLAIDGGNGSIKWALSQDGKVVAKGSVPHLILPTPHPFAASVDGKTFVYGAVAAKLNLQAAYNPGRTGSHAGKTQALDMVLATAVIEAKLVERDDTVDVAVRYATPLNCQVKAHKALIGTHMVVAPQGAGSVLVNVVDVTSYQECRPLLSKFDGVVDLGSGTSFYGWNDGDGKPVIKSFEQGVNRIIESAVDDCKISERFAAIAASSKGVLSPEGLSAALASGRAVKDGSIQYKGVEFSDVLEPLVQKYWMDIVYRAISQCGANAVPRGKHPIIGIVGGGAALLQAVLPGVKESAGAAAAKFDAQVKFISKPATQLAVAMAEAL